ncbi:MAG TPA: hypothetical protein VIW94_02715 [Acidimicrobiia bacterium]
MTVLQRKEAMGVDSAKLGKIVGSVALVAAIGFGFAIAMSNINDTETVAPASIGATQGLAKSAQVNQALNGAVGTAAVGATQGLAKSAQVNQALNGAVGTAAIGAYGLSQSALANQALNGETAASTSGPFLAGHPSQTHKGRNGATPASGSEWSTVGDPISARIPDYPQGDAGTSGGPSGSNSGGLFPR